MSRRVWGFVGIATIRTPSRARRNFAGSHNDARLT